MIAPNVSESTIVFDGTTFESTADWLRSTRRSKARTPARYDAARDASANVNREETRAYYASLLGQLDSRRQLYALLLAAERRAGAGVTLRSGILAALGAVALGVVGGGLSSTAATAQVPTLTPFGPAMPLAPSTLLAFQ